MMPCRPGELIYSLRLFSKNYFFVGADLYEVETSAKVSCRIAALGCPYYIEAQARAPTLHFDEEGQDRDFRRGLKLQSKTY